MVGSSMAQVKVLLCKIGFLSALIILTCFIIMVVAGSQKNHYLASVIDKHKLLKVTQSPRVILVGGSNVAFGLDSAIIQHELRLPVVNMAIKATIGLHYMLEEVKPFIGHGDLVMVMPEYEQFYGDLPNGNDDVWLLLWYSPDGYRNLRSPSQYLALLKSFHVFMFTRSRVAWDKLTTVLRMKPESKPDLYSRSSFNEHGDFVAHLSLSPSWDGCFPTQKDETLNEETFSSLQNLSKYAARKKAKMVFFWPSIPETFYVAQKAWIQRIVSKMNQYPDIRVHGTPFDSVLPVNNFFDSPYHLNATARLKRTLAISRFLLHMDK